MEATNNKSGAFEIHIMQFNWNLPVFLVFEMYCYRILRKKMYQLVQSTVARYCMSWKNHLATHIETEIELIRIGSLLLMNHGEFRINYEWIRRNRIGSAGNELKKKRKYDWQHEINTIADHVIAQMSSS